MNKIVKKILDAIPEENIIFLLFLFAGMFIASIIIGV